MRATARAESYRRDLVAALVASGMVRSGWVREAFETTPREVFVPRFSRRVGRKTVVMDGAVAGRHDEWLRAVYSDEVLTVQCTTAPDVVDAGGVPTSSSSMPTVMAGMLEALDLRPGHRVLEIGTGTGYNAALLCHRVGADNVTTVELDPRLADLARQALARAGLHPLVHVGDGAAGAAAAAPFDRIIATASADHIPPAWISQLTPGGAIVVDLRGSLAGGLVRLIRVGEDIVQGTFVDLPGAFMPMRTHPHSPHRDGEDWDRVRLDKRNPHIGRTALDPALLTTEPSLRFLLQLHLAGRRLRGFGPTVDGSEVAGHGTDASWFDVHSVPDEAVTHDDMDALYTVRQGGPQRLWDTVETTFTAWQRLGRPSIDQFRVTATDDAELQHAWHSNGDASMRWPLPL